MAELVSAKWNVQKKKLFDRISDLENRIIKDKDKKLYTISDECIEKIIKRKCEIKSKINNDTIYKKNDGGN